MKLENFEIGDVIELTKNNVEQYEHIIGSEMVRVIKESVDIKTCSLTVTGIDADNKMITISIEK